MMMMDKNVTVLTFNTCDNASQTMYIEEIEHNILEQEHHG